MGLGNFEQFELCGCLILDFTTTAIITIVMAFVMNWYAENQENMKAKEKGKKRDGKKETFFFFGGGWGILYLFPSNFENKSFF